MRDIKTATEVIHISKSQIAPCKCKLPSVTIYSWGFWLPTVEVCRSCGETWEQEALVPRT